MKSLSISRNSGFSMIEVLIAVLILAVGLLGVAALQTNALKNNQSALQRSQATMLSYYMMDAMRANRAVALLGSYNLTKTCSAPSAGTLITNDQIAWINALKANLGNQSSTCGEITCNTNSCTVKVYWDDSRSVGGGSSQVVEIASRI
ncbi:type IV pilus modification protein PilV [Methylomonas sp. LL1]|uniref:type IV pilus modification protein PilV n=1 Tax=Methylomonas sp. LL1 TaxID=2785785 RepID=UPI0018C3DAB0|nr:type IV pilus modification protein PilV [Methylomonas sp. LL1]QPK64183.1 type IV pilus modification protein PilV [Methylomonas sp. LL1]